jgi:hypothetical protein
MLKRGSMGRYRRYAIFLLVLVLFFSTTAVVSHCHENTSDDIDCPICIAVNYQSVAALSIAAFDTIPFLTETTVNISTPLLTENLFVASCSTRGPPA